MAQHNIIPRHLANTPTPTCTACMLAKSTQEQWRNKILKNWIEMQTSEGTGYIVSVNQLLSPIPGFISQITGIMNKERYKYAAVNVEKNTQE